MIEGDPVERFAACANAANATVHILDSLADVPAFVSELLRSRNMPEVVHLPADMAAAGIGWDSARVSREPPGPDDTAVSIAAYGVAETGTLVFPASTGRPASWHFRPGFEIAVLKADDILSNLETTLSKLRAAKLAAHDQSRHRAFAHRRYRTNAGTRRTRPEGAGNSAYSGRAQQADLAIELVHQGLQRVALLRGKA